MDVHTPQPPDPDDLLTALMARYDEALAGDTPVDVVDTSVVEADADLATDWDSAKECLELLDRVRRRWNPSDHDSADAGDTETALQVNPIVHLRNLGRFRLERELGSGGLGIVYLAFDPKLGRRVALKVPRVESLVSGELRRRFVREAEAAARLSHPNIVTVHEAGEEGLICYIAAEYCAGSSLAEWLAERTAPVPLAPAAVLVKQLAEAVQHAHSRGVLHRDIKPSNVLLDKAVGKDGATAVETIDGLCPKLADFGMAKLLETSGDETRTGSIIGTPAYMSPEQAQGKTRDLDARVDIYALGAMLYELLTGEKAIAGETHVETLRRVVEQDPKPPRLLRPDVSRDLEAICLKCLNKDRDGRYATAQELADDLGRYLAGLPTEARPPRPVERLVKWIRRRPVIAGLLGLLAVAMLTIVGGTINYNARLRKTAADLRVQTEVARANEREAREYVYGTDMMLAAEAWDNSVADKARNLLKRHIPTTGEDDLRGIEWYSLWNRFEQDSTVVAEQVTPIWSLAAAPDGQRFATGDPEGVIRLWDFGFRKLLRELRGHGPGCIDRLIFLPDGQRLISAADDHTIRWWDVATGKNTLTWQEHSDWVGALAMSADGRWLVSGGGDGRVLLWNIASKSLQRELYRHAGAVRWAVFNPKRPWIVSSCEAGEVRIWDFELNQPPAAIPTGRLEFPAEPKKPRLSRNAVFRPDGRALYADRHNAILEWNLGDDTPADQRLSVLNPWQDRAMVLEYVRNSGLLVEGGDHEPALSTRRFNALTRAVHQLHGHSDSIRCLAAMPDLSTILSGSEDGTVRHWSLAESDPEGRTIDSPTGVRALAWSPGNDRLWIADDSHQVYTVDDFETPAIAEHGQPFGEVRWILPLKDKSRALGVDRGGQCFAHQGGASRPVFHLPPDVDDVAIDGDCRWLASGQKNGVSLLDAADGRIVWQSDLTVACSHVVFLPGGDVAAGCADGVVYRLDKSNGRIVRQSANQRAMILWLDVSDNGQRLLTAAGSKTVRILNAATFAELAVFARSRNPLCAWFVDHDQRLLIADHKRISVVHPRTGQDLMAIRDRYDGPAQVSPDGRWLASERGHSVLLKRLRWD